MSLACGWDAPTVPWSFEAPFSLGGGGGGSRDQETIQGKPQAAASFVQMTGREGEGEGEGEGRGMDSGICLFIPYLSTAMT